MAKQKEPKSSKAGASKEAAAAPARAAVKLEPPRMRERMRGPVAERIRRDFGVKNVMAMPRLEKIIVNVGMGKQLDGIKLNPVAKEQVLSDLSTITGQKPIVQRAKKSVSNFKLREGSEIGAMVTLRGAKMWEFFDRLVSLGIPRIKDFRGLNPNSMDGRGNYSFGVDEQGIFPEVDMAKAKFTHGMNITFVFRNSTDDKTRAVLSELGVPFSKPEDRRA
jgi:large subunit ribosomal protein L5